MSGLTYRLATEADIPAIGSVMDRAIESLQRPYLSSAQVVASRLSMGLDPQLIADRTYFLVENDGVPVGCGGWSYRAPSAATPDDGPGDLRTLDPATQAARVSAMYTDPDFVRRGVGRLVLALCEDAARAAGFKRVELMATLAGEPLYLACGYTPIERVAKMSEDGLPVPGVRMDKALD